MALGQVSARVEGDIYQGIFFWNLAADLLLPSSKVIRVDIEYDAAAGADDVAVFYESPGVDAGGWQCTADYYQVKYHVDQSANYTYRTVVEPANANTDSSLLKRFHHAYSRLRNNPHRFRLHLVSNWNWQEEDPLPSVIRDTEGAFSDAFFRGGEQSRIGALRKLWREHLGIQPDEFSDFCRCLRFQLNYLGRRGMRELVHSRLALAGVKPACPESRVDPLEALYMRFLTDRTTSFTPESLRAVLKNEGLLSGTTNCNQTAQSRVLGIRSFIRFAENIENETDEHVCVSKFFDGRHIREPADWNHGVQTNIYEFLTEPARQTRLRGQEHLVLLDCHLSIAYLAGSCLSTISGARVTVRQKGNLGGDWRTSGYIDEKWGIDRTISVIDDAKTDIAVVVSITHRIVEDVQGYIATTELLAGTIVSFAPSDEIGSSAIENADHAWWLAERMAAELYSLRKKNPTASLHLFVSAPNAFLFYLGQHHGMLGKVQLYEYDFGFEKDASYSKSILI